ncbi:UNVERIFIED_CONTAM: spermidine/putrescine-binding protein [Brevibacillus sp. OAP136]
MGVMIRSHQSKRQHRLWAALIVGLSLLLLAACSQTPAATNGQKPGGEVVFSNWSDFTPETMLKNFEQETGIKVKFSTFSSNEEVLAKLSAGGLGNYDLIVVSDYTVDILRKQGMLEEIDKTNIPNFKNLIPSFLDQAFDPGNKYSIPYMAGNVIIAYNKNTVKKPITGYADLWDPEFVNNLVVLDDQRTLIGITNKMQGKSMNDTDPAVLKKSLDLLLALKPNIKAFDSDSPQKHADQRRGEGRDRLGSRGGAGPQRQPVDRHGQSEGRHAAVDRQPGDSKRCAAQAKCRGVHQFHSGRQKQRGADKSVSVHAAQFSRP